MPTEELKRPEPGVTKRPPRKKGRAAVAEKAGRLERLEIVYVPVDSIKPNSYNPNRQSDHDFELLCRSIEDDGFTQPLVAVKGEGGETIIVDGEHRWRAARQLGYVEVPIVIVPMTPEQARIATLRHNRARGSEDIELAAAVLRDLRELGALDWAQDSLLIDDVELQNLLDDVPAPEALASDEFSEAWRPTKGSGESSERPGSQESFTAEAADKLREVEKKLEAARTDEEREAARRDSGVFRLVCVFAGDEAGVVRRALGDRPAARVLELCRAADRGAPAGYDPPKAMP